MHYLTIEIAKEHRKDLLREAERYYLLYPSFSRLQNSPGFYEKRTQENILVKIDLSEKMIRQFLNRAV